LTHETEDVELVDPRRHDQERPAEHLLGRGRVLDQLHELVLEHDLARRHGHVLAQAEGAVVGHGDVQAPLAPLQVVEQVLHALEQVLAAGLDGRAQDLRIGQHEVAGRQRVDPLPRVELDLPGGLLVQPVDPAHRGLGPVGGQQVRLLDEIEGGVLVPALVLEAAVALVGRGHRLATVAEPALERGLPQGGGVAPQLGLRLVERRRVGHRLQAPLDERRADDARVRDAEAVALGLAAQGLLEHLLSALGQARPALDEGVRFVRRGRLVAARCHGGNSLRLSARLRHKSPARGRVSA
jgi:hypothetical protein